ncbi:LPS export ABC transporter permease LptF [Frigidibacter sp. MR17.14]|uniref:LPS export ABC transporter permease LptF n=1 Tax=Frigidibacter sp. MR17.14 TaxID=3126509 RepID=UPI00301305EE
MARFDRYMLSQLMALFGFFALILVSIYWINQAVALFEQLISDGQSAMVFVRFSALTLPNVIRLVLPVAAFVAAVYVTNRLSAESELTVMQATGFSPWRMARPAVYFGAIVAALLLVLTHVLVPATRGELATQRFQIANDATAKLLVEGSFQHPAKGITIYIREVATDGQLHDVYISDARDPASRTSYFGKRALLARDDTGPKLIMFEGMAQTYSPDNRRLAVTHFTDFTYDIGALITQTERGTIDIRELSTMRLVAEDPADLALTESTVHEFRVEAQSRIAQPLTAAALAVLGVATMLTAGFSRFGNARTIGLSVLLAILVQLAANVGTQLADKEDGLAAAVYLPVLVGAVIDCLLLWWAGRPRRVPAMAAPAQGATA